MTSTTICQYCGITKIMHTEYGWNKHQTEKVYLSDSPTLKRRIASQ